MLKTRQEGGGRGKGTSLARSETLQLRLSSQLLVCGQMLFCYSPQFPTDRLPQFVRDLISLLARTF